MPGKKLSRHRYFNVSQLGQSGIGILALGTVRYNLSRVSPRMASYAVLITVHAKTKRESLQHHTQKQTAPLPKAIEFLD
jgi:hypothetical protein